MAKIGALIGVSRHSLYKYEHREQYSLVLMCRVLKVARAGFFQWLHKPLSDRAVEDQRLVEMIRNSYAASGGRYAARRVFGDLREAGETCGKHRAERLIRANKIKAVRGYKAPPPISGHPRSSHRTDLSANLLSMDRTRPG